MCPFVGRQSALVCDFFKAEFAIETHVVSVVDPFGIQPCGTQKSELNARKRMLFETHDSTYH